MLGEEIVNFKYHPHLCGKELLVVSMKETCGKEGKQPSTKTAITKAHACAICHHSYSLPRRQCQVGQQINLVINQVTWIEASLVVNWAEIIMLM